MKGIVFNIVSDIVIAEYGDVVWDEVVEDAGVGGAYTSLGSYDDSELNAIVATMARRLGVSEFDVLRFVGQRAVPLFHNRYPELFDQPDTLTMLLALNGIIHPEVYKLYPGARPPEFSYDVVTPDRLEMGYDSDRRMCGFAEGLILGVAEHFDDQVLVFQSNCMLQGAESCTIVVERPGEPG